MVSFIIPVYNEEKYIKRCLESIVNNTNVNNEYEIIVVDDGSIDNTLEIIEEVREGHCAIKVFSQNNAGVSFARETGIKEASGEWIVFVDADDCVTSDIVECIEMLRNQKYDWIIFSGQFQKSSILDMNRLGNQRSIIKAILNQNQENEMKNVHLNAVWSKAYRKDIIEKYEIRFEKSLSHGEDMIFNLDYFRNCSRLYCCSESVYKLYANKNSVTHRYQENCMKNDKEFFVKLNKRESFSHDSSLMICYYRMVLNGIWICLKQYFSHYENKKSLNVRRRELTEFLSQEPYKTALMNYSVERSRGKKCVFVLINLHFYSLVLKMVELLRKSSEEGEMESSEI